MGQRQPNYCDPKFRRRFIDVISSDYELFIDERKLELADLDLFTTVERQVRTYSLLVKRSKGEVNNYHAIKCGVYHLLFMLRILKQHSNFLDDWLPEEEVDRGDHFQAGNLRLYWR